MDRLQVDLLDKLIIIELKCEVLSMLHGLQFDGVYDIKHCIEDLNKLLKHLDDIEAPHYLILRNNGLVKSKDEKTTEIEVPV